MSNEYLITENEREKNEAKEEFYDELSEQTLLGTLLNCPELLDVYGTSLQKSDFNSEASRLIYEFIDVYRGYYGNDFTDLKVRRVFRKLCQENASYGVISKEEDFYECALMPLMDLGLKDGEKDNRFYRTVKGLSTLRKLKDLGFPIDKFVNKGDVSKLSSEEILTKLSENLDKLRENNGENTGCIISENLVTCLKDLLISPEKGLVTPFNFINENLNGFTKNSLTMIGGLSNTGKSRLMIYILLYLILRNKVKVCLLSNEMTQAEFSHIIITTILNMPLFQAMHGKLIKVEQSTVTKAEFTDKNGRILKKGEEETKEAFVYRVLEESPLFSDVMDILVCFEENFGECFHFVNISEDYSPERIKAVIKAMKQKGCTVFAYDTLKAYKSSEWQELTQSATVFSELIKGDRDGIIGITSFQLTDHSQLYSPEDLSSMNIATAKHIMHVADSMIMFLRIKKEECRNFTIDNNKKFSDGKNYLAAKIIKNRNGNGKDKLYALSADYGCNLWQEEGELTPVKR
ncbi:MAG: hypothetical protein J6M16_04355 [Clostridia bacterium]|nr:hypothetical protein [Clostridia bacterium]